MTEQQLNTLRQQDNNLRDAIQQDAMEQPQMPADLNARLMQRVTAEKRQPRRILWPWVAAACVAGMLMIWLTPPKDEAPEVAQTPATVVQQPATLIAQQAPHEEPAPAVSATQPAPVAKKAPAKSKAHTVKTVTTEPKRAHRAGGTGPDEAASPRGLSEMGGTGTRDIQTLHRTNSPK